MGKNRLGIQQSKEEFEESEKNAKIKSRKNVDDLLSNIHKTIGEVKYGNIKAKNGFNGIINKKTKFTVGEGNKKEFVSRKKLTDFDFMGGMKF